MKKVGEGMDSTLLALMGNAILRFAERMCMEVMEKKLISDRFWNSETKFLNTRRAQRREHSSSESSEDESILQRGMEKVKRKRMKIV